MLKLNKKLLGFSIAALSGVSVLMLLSSATLIGIGVYNLVNYPEITNISADIQPIRDHMSLKNLNIFTNLNIFKLSPALTMLSAALSLAIGIATTYSAYRLSKKFKNLTKAPEEKEINIEYVPCYPPYSHFNNFLH